MNKFELSPALQVLEMNTVKCRHVGMVS